MGCRLNGLRVDITESVGIYLIDGIRYTVTRGKNYRRNMVTYYYRKHGRVNYTYIKPEVFETLIKIEKE